MSKEKKGKCFICARFYSKWCASCSEHYSHWVSVPTPKPKAEETLKACPLPWTLIDDSQTDGQDLTIRLWAVRAANGRNVFRLTGSPEMKEVGERIVEAVNQCQSVKTEIERLTKLSQCDHGTPWDTDCPQCEEENKRLAKFVHDHSPDRRSPAKDEGFPRIEDDGSGRMRRYKCPKCGDVVRYAPLCSTCGVPMEESKPTATADEGEDLFDDLTPCALWDETRCGGMPCLVRNCGKAAEAIAVIREQRDEYCAALAEKEKKLGAAHGAWEESQKRIEELEISTVPSDEYNLVCDQKYALRAKLKSAEAVVKAARALTESVHSSFGWNLKAALSAHDKEDEVSPCPHCHCMTHTVDGKCGKCGGQIVVTK